jgi:hypothetical protein
MLLGAFLDDTHYPILSLPIRWTLLYSAESIMTRSVVITHKSRRAIFSF